MNNLLVLFGATAVLCALALDLTEVQDRAILVESQMSALACGHGGDVSACWLQAEAMVGGE